MFLKKFGELVLKGLQIVLGVAPIVEKLVPGGVTTVVISDLEQIASIIQNVEVMGQALNQAGPQKLVAAAPLVAQIILQSSLLVNKKIADPAKFQAGVASMASGMADVLSSLKDDVQTENKA